MILLFHAIYYFYYCVLSLMTDFLQGKKLSSPPVCGNSPTGCIVLNFLISPQGKEVY